MVTPQGPALRGHRLLRMPVGVGSRRSHACAEVALPEGLVSGTAPRQARGLPGRGQGEPIHPCPGSEVIFPPCWVGEGAPRGTDPVPSQHLGQPSAFQGAPGDLAVCESPKAPRRLKAPPSHGVHPRLSLSEATRLQPPLASSAPPSAAAAFFPAEGTCTNIDLKTLMRQDRASWELPPTPVMLGRA